MTGRRTAWSALALVAVLALVVLAAVQLLGAGDGPDDGLPGAGPTDVASEAAPPEGAPASPSPPTGMDPEVAVRLLSSVAAAAAAPGEDLLEAGLVAGRGPWRHLGDPAWPMRAERPVYVGEVTLTTDAVSADVVVARRLERDTDLLELRLLPAAVGDNGLQVRATVDGETAAAEAGDGGLLTVAFPEARDAGSAVAVRIELRYDVLTREQAPDDRGPAAYGVLARSVGTTALGHWLPVLTFEPEPVVPWGDVGSFPVAVWSLRVAHPGVLVTGGSESDCPAPLDGGANCTWARGLALRDVSAVLFDETEEVTSSASGLTIRAVARPTVGEAALETVLEESVGSAEGFTRRFGALAWPEVDVVAVPLGGGAAGVEFPGMVMIDDDLYGQLSGGFGTFVVFHEVAHQWFHALVGNGSFSDPVVDEPLAQYLAVLAYRDLFGAEAASSLVDQAFVDRYLAFRSTGLDEEPPAQPSDGFAGADTYGPMVYARAPLAWLAAEDGLGEDAVVRFVADLVDTYGLEVLTAEELVAAANVRSDAFGAILERYWYADGPVPAP